MLADDGIIVSGFSTVITKNRTVDNIPLDTAASSKDVFVKEFETGTYLNIKTPVADKIGTPRKCGLHEGLRRGIIHERYRHHEDSWFIVLLISLLHSTGTSDTALIPTLKCLIVPNRENMDKPKIIINSHSKEKQFKLILDTGSNNWISLMYFSDNDILKDSIINQKDKIIKLNNSTYKINYQESNQLHCNVKAPRKHVTVSNDNQSQSHNLLDDDEDIKEQVTKFVESIPSQLCDILVKTNPEEEEIQAVRDFINDSFEDVIVDKILIFQIRLTIPEEKDQDVEPTKKQIYYSTDDHKRHVEEMVIKFIDLEEDSWRVVHDYRQLNKVTIRDDHPFTPVDSLLNQCKDSKLFSKFDMIMGYFQVLINPEHAKYTAFITHIGKFEYTRMPQGLVNSPSTFARLMVEIFGKIKSLLQYFDDLLVHSKLDYMVHFIEIIRMLLYCRKYLLFISREKSEMLKTEVDFLGFHIHKDGISPRAAKVRAISELPEPRNAKEAEAALGLFGFFRRHIENYAEKTYHLSKESKGKNKKTLSDESLKEFNNLKKEFEGENIVAIPMG
ncbi:hypothetical protein DDB_G0294320 [Dictyostelium discoideum AX4]|uniref:Reverse transcriptase domain-containing protein n=1 Tax=Dictyostelium discoideum TaxID=44689 RepID=Q54AN6_DICDI|nr:hypothetical protein DDB_G0294320 [Dictyostelium discoideum AX4]EAL60325.1 hypothetical protein DDB_G0294320 [Dictyostelium discoideum AX4]|eukprot:XP_628738.1 hypothetical protein DDB_G0294320 [Dictyostelium discoideum AX4]